MDSKLLDFVDSQVEAHVPRKHWVQDLLEQGHTIEEVETAYHEAIKRKHLEFEKKLIHRIVDVALPIGVFLAFYIFYNHFKLTATELIKTTGLTAITLIAITLFVGPTSKFIRFFNNLKIHRKFWGVTGFLVAVLHSLLAFSQYYNFSLASLFDSTNPRFTGVLAGLTAILIFVIITSTSNKAAVDLIGAKNWKLIQTASYLALFFILIHFYLMETTNGVFVIKRLMGRVAFGFAIFVILLRLFVLVLTFFQHRKPPTPDQSAYQTYLKNLSQPPSQP